MITRTDYVPAIAKMKAKPGTWFKLNTYGTKGSACTAALMLRKGYGIKAFVGPAGCFETKLLKETDKGVEVRARYVGETVKARRK